MTQTIIDRPQVKSGTCAQCWYYRDGICQTKAQAGWGDDAKMPPNRKACPFAELLPF